MKFSLEITERGIFINGDIQSIIKRKERIYTGKGKIKNSAIATVVKTENATNLSTKRKPCLECGQSFLLQLTDKGKLIGGKKFCSDKCQRKFSLRPKSQKELMRATYSTNYGNGSSKYVVSKAKASTASK